MRFSGSLSAILADPGGGRGAKCDLSGQERPGLWPWESVPASTLAGCRWSGRSRGGRVGEGRAFDPFGHQCGTDRRAVFKARSHSVQGRIIL